jgi:predicted RNA-binding Zn ribbon-like protein
MQFNTYTYSGVQIAAWLANNSQASAADLAGLLASHEVHDPGTTAAQARALRPWAGELRAVFAADAAAVKAERADALLVAADCRPRLVSHGSGLPYHLHYVSVRAGLAARVKALTAAGLAHAIDDGAALRLRACSRAGCSTAFFDTSRNGRRHFCGLRCANHVNVANHRLRQRQALAAGR